MIQVPSQASPLNPRRLALALILGLLLSTTILTVESRVSVLPVVLPWSFHLSLLGFYYFSLWVHMWAKKSLGQVLLTICLALYGLVFLNYSLEFPSQVFLVLAGLSFSIFANFRIKACPFHPLNLAQFTRQLLLYTSLGTSALWLFIFVFRTTGDSLSFIIAVLGAIFVLGLFVAYTLFVEPRRRGPLWILLWGTLSLFGIILGVEGSWQLKPFALSSGLFPLLGLSLSIPTRQIRDRINARIEAIFFHPEGSILLTFLALCLLGTILLLLPGSSADAKSFALIDAAFTAVSAVCVTGLTVLDTATDFSLGGQLIILALIQAGGLGIMFLSALALLFIGQRVSLRQESALMSVLGQRLKGEMRSVLRRVLRLTFMLEAVGALILTLAYRKYFDSWLEAFWHGIFTAISAFCNAGFALQTRSLIPFREDHLILHTVAALIILGGLSPGFILALPRFRQVLLRSVQLRMILVCTSALLLGGTILFLGIEWNRSLAELSSAQKWTNAWFQSVTTRTAGFNSVDLALLAPASQLLMMMLMFIGGSPGGTAGGIKTITFVVLLLAVRSVAKSRREVEVFHRQLPTETILRALAVAAMTLLLVLVSFFALMLTQELAPFPLLFEVFSAVGTVGLSLGLTAELNPIGKFLLMFCMYVGRIGPLTVVLYLIRNDQSQNRKLPEEAVSIG